jgi:hypothetical protein
MQSIAPIKLFTFCTFPGFPSLYETLGWFVPVGIFALFWVEHPILNWLKMMFGLDRNIPTGVDNP